MLPIDEYFKKIVNNYLNARKDKSGLNKAVQALYDACLYGLEDEKDRLLLFLLEKYNLSQDVPYLASGQNGYFHDQIMSNGLGGFKLKEEDREDAKFISSCFGKIRDYSSNNVPITYTTLLGTKEFNYAVKTFPAGIFEDVFQCAAVHILPIPPLVGESENDFYLRLLEYQIDSYPDFDYSKKDEVLMRGKRLIDNFCGHKNKVYLIKMSDVEELKASFGDVYGLRGGGVTPLEAQKILDGLDTFKELIEGIHPKLVYNDSNLTSEYGIALYGIVDPSKIQYINVERNYDIMQRMSIEHGIAPGEPVLGIFNPKAVSFKKLK